MGDEGGDGVFHSIGGPFPTFGMPYQEYDLDTVIVDHISCITFQIRDVLEGQVNSNINPMIVKKIKKQKWVTTKELKPEVFCLWQLYMFDYFLFNSI